MSLSTTRSRRRARERKNGGLANMAGAAVASFVAILGHEVAAGVVSEASSAVYPQGAKTRTAFQVPSVAVRGASWVSGRGGLASSSVTALNKPAVSSRIETDYRGSSSTSSFAGTRGSSREIGFFSPAAVARARIARFPHGLNGNNQWSTVANRNGHNNGNNIRTKNGDLRMTDSSTASSSGGGAGASAGGGGGGGGAAPWLARGLKALVRGGRGDQGTQLPSLSAVMEAVDARGAEDAVVAAEGRSKMQGMMSSELPTHPQMREGTLPNGLRYIILLNKSPPERFEAHLEVFAGSADELDTQQGMAHLVEHVAYMGSRKRERLFGTGSSTNAYTDFHHTVFYASCPVLTPPGWGRPTPMLGRALGALLDVLEAICEESRLEKERSAVLSELTMVNTIEYRMECQILAALHAENQLSRRFPIGKEELIKGWNTQDVLAFHRKHYRPDNAVLYCIGDLNLDDTEEQIRQMFGHLGGVPDVSEPPNLKRQSLSFPPVTHQWCGGHVTERNTLPVMEPVDGKPLGSPRVYKHDLLQAFSLHLYAKRPLEPITKLGDFRRAMMKRICLAALQIRVSVNSRADPPYLSLEFNQLDSPREGCSVCFLDISAEPHKWREAVKLAVREVRRLGMYGLTTRELTRFSSALLTDARQLAAQGNRIGNVEQLTFLMDSVASGHTFMDTEQTYLATRLVIESLTLEELNEVAAELCEHITLFGMPRAPQPSAIIACMPTAIKVPPAPGAASNVAPEEGRTTEMTEEGVVAAIYEGVNEELGESTADVEVPKAFFTTDELNKLLEETKPEWVPASTYFDPAKETTGKIGRGGLYVEEPSTGTRLRRLNNGIRVNVIKQEHESQRGQVRVTFPGGRQLETLLGNGAVVIGARTMQEGGAFGRWIREEVELFCIDHLVIVTVEANDEFLFLDLAFPTTKLHLPGRETNADGSDDMVGGLNGMEAAFQVVHQILTGFVWEEEAFKRAKQSFVHSHETLIKSLEGRSTETLMDGMSGSDGRFMSVPHADIEVLTLDQVSKAINLHLATSHMEVSLVGDFDIAEAERLTLQYLGTLDKVERDPEFLPKMEAVPWVDIKLPRHIDVHLEDSDDRAVGYVAGTTPNRWGMMRDGSSVLDLFPAASTGQHEYRTHKLFAPVALQMLKEALNRRLFSVVREQKRLTYDANIHLTSFDRLLGAWYLITVTANPDKVDEAIKACQDTLRDMSGPLPITADNVESAKRVLINRHDGELRQNAYWCDLLTGLQLDCLPNKDMSCVRDYNAVVNAVTAQDLQVVLKSLTTDRSKMFTCAGVSGQKPLPRLAGKSGLLAYP